MSTTEPPPTPPPAEAPANAAPPPGVTGTMTIIASSTIIYRTVSAQASDLRATLKRLLAGQAIAAEERTRTLNEVLSQPDTLAAQLESTAQERAKALPESHRRVRRLAREPQVTVKAQLRVGIPGRYLPMPVPEGIL